MNYIKIIYFSCFIAAFSACKAPRLTTNTATDEVVKYHGRTLKNAQNDVDLISAAAFAEFQFTGNTCELSLINHATPTDYNYVAIELDNEYKGRIKVSNATPTSFIIKANQRKKWHLLRVFKATEPQNGVITINNIRAKNLQKRPYISQKSIEFIGNSITCGMGNDARDIPCGGDSKWYDQHNAYWSYATKVAQALDLDFTLNSISGAGIYRNWNSDSPTLPQQYNQTYLVLDSVQKWDFSRKQPDIVSIALGTNDLSLGDGKTMRLPFDSTLFVNTYFDFIKTIYSHSPNTQFLLLNSPMVAGERGVLLTNCLKAVQEKAADELPEMKNIKVFEFTAVSATGCSGHPNAAEHALMAQQLLPFMRKVVEDLK